MVSFAQLQGQDAPSYGDISPHLYVPFKARPFRDARIAWLNQRWFQAAGVDCTSPVERAGVEQWLLDHFGVGVSSDDDPEDQYLSTERLLYADRYGAPSGSVHGGSGRVGTWGAFNAKGVGRTPLASRRSDWYHSHGCMFLEEAVREAVLSEVSAAIFPHGVVPTIAVIDTGARLRWRDGTWGERRAIVIRPAFLRIANLMRTIYFGTAGYPGSDQTADAACVRDMWRLFSDDELLGAFGIVGAQYGFGNALRLWPGPFFVSNFTITGELVDFGSFRALPNWLRAKGESRAHCFGGEATLVEMAARSLGRNAMCVARALDPAALTQRFHEGFDRGFSMALTRNGIDPASPAAREIGALRMQQQRQVVDVKGGALEGVSIGGLQPYAALYRESLQADAQAMISGLGDGPDRDGAVIGTFIDDYVARCVAPLRGER